MRFLNSSTPLIVTTIVILLIVGMGVLNYTGIQISYISWLQKGIFNVISPVINYFSYIYNHIISYWQGLMNVDEIVEKNSQLEKKVARLEDRIRILKASHRQDQRLEKLETFLDAFKDFSDYKVQGASVIGYGPTNWEEKMLINQGSADGLKEKMPVISYNGVLVGRISSVGANTAQVMLLNSPDFAVGGIVQNSRVIGLVKGQLNKEKVNVMEKIPADSGIEKGDRILTSGLSNNFPKYLPIGKVTRVESDNFGISRKAQIDLFFNEYTIEEVLVITDFRR